MVGEGKKAIVDIGQDKTNKLSWVSWHPLLESREYLLENKSKNKTKKVKTKSCWKLSNTK